jgi:hypothetical protein
MPEKVDLKNTEPEKNPTVYFKCKYCGETKPLEELVVLRQFFPQISICQACSIAASNAR